MSPQEKAREYNNLRSEFQNTHGVTRWAEIPQEDIRTGMRATFKRHVERRCPCDVLKGNVAA